MLPADLPYDEPKRLEALQRFAILDTPAELAYDDIVAIASAICGTPTALVSLVDAERQWFKARKGLDVSETGRDIAFCAHAILHPEQVMEVPDALLDERFHDNPLVVGGPRIRFYAGAPLVSTDGQPVGTLCVIDSKPHHLDDVQRGALEALSRQVMAQMELRVAYRELRHHLGEREWYERELEARREWLDQENAVLLEQSRLDPLTGIANRRAFGQWIEEALAGVEPFAFAIVDVDHFKQINDARGHPFGDRVLVAVAAALGEAVHPAASVGRIGGEEFALVLPGCNAKQAVACADDVRLAITRIDLDVPITASVGVTVRREADIASDLYSRADAALYDAKRGGRNRVCAR